MKKEDFEALGIAPEQAEKAAAAWADAIKGFIPKHRFDEVNEAKKLADEAVKERDGQLTELKKTAGMSEELKTQITKLQDENKLKDETHAAELKKIKRETIDNSILADEKAKNAKATLGLLEAIDPSVDEETYKIKRQAQIKALKADESTKFLFEIEENPANKYKGGKPPEGSGSGKDKGGAEKNPWSKEHYNLTEQGRILRENPELAAHYKSLA